MLNWTERIMRMRKEVPEIGWGRFVVLPSGTPEVLVLRYDWRNNAVLFVHNLAATPREIDLEPVTLTGEKQDLINLLSENHSYADDAGMHHIRLEPYGYRWYRVGGLDYLLKRSDSLAVGLCWPESSRMTPSAGRRSRTACHRLTLPVELGRKQQARAPAHPPAASSAAVLAEIQRHQQAAILVMTPLERENIAFGVTGDIGAGMQRRPLPAQRDQAAIERQHRHAVSSQRRHIAGLRDRHSAAARACLR